MMIKTLIFLALLIIGFLPACTLSTESTIELDGTRWKLQNLEDQQVLQGTTITLEFRGGQMKGSAGCNSYGADYAIQARNGITFGSIVRNLEACIEPAGIMEQEEQYLHALWTITNYRAEEDRLTPLDEHDKALLQYERRPEFQVNSDDLVGRTWQLVSATGFDEGSLSSFTIRFEGREFGGTTATMGLSEAFLGLIVIPLIGNAAEHATAVVVARKGQMDLSLSIALGSSTQVALLVAPLLVGAGLLLGQPMDLVFTPFEVAAVGLTTIIAAILTLDGEGHWFEGTQLLAMYLLVAAAAFFL